MMLLWFLAPHCTCTCSPKSAFQKCRGPRSPIDADPLVRAISAGLALQNEFSLTDIQSVWKHITVFLQDTSWQDAEQEESIPSLTGLWAELCSVG